MIRKLAFFSLLLTLIVIVLGAYVRLSDAGLGCPDWPGCYGELTPHHAKDEILVAHAADSDGPVSMPKAWKEMVHRYLASFLGLLILALAWKSLRRWKRDGVSATAPLMLVGVVIFQGMLGMWTVTLLLKPAIVSLHLLGGLAVLGILTWVWMRESGVARHAAGVGLSFAARVAFVLLLLQIALGGWVSTNYAALACPDFPTCQNSWLPNMDFENAFHVLRELGRTVEGEILPAAAMTAIHWSHRVGAIIVGVYLLVFSWRLMRYDELRSLALSLALAVLLQIALGISNVIFSLPLTLAVAHNGMAAVLVMLVVATNYRLRAVRAGAHMERIWNERLAA